MLELDSASPDRNLTNACLSNTVSQVPQPVGAMYSRNVAGDKLL